MASIDERIVAMSFDNAKFESGVAQTMTTLTKLNSALAKVGGDSKGFSDIEKAASKVTLLGPMSALDKLRARLGMAGQGAAEGFSDIEKASNKVSLLNPMTAIDKLRARLSGVGTGAADGFSEVEKASNKVTLEGASTAVDKLKGQFGTMGEPAAQGMGEVDKAIDSTANHFSVLSGAAAVALGNIATKAAAAGAQFAKGFGLGPITQGFQEYATNLQSIQTILANTQASGAGLKDVNKALQQLNHYSDQTIYNFSEMARNIGTFTAAGVDLKTATSAIKGIANLAALSGSNSQQASTAMYQLSQAIAAGRVSLQDWNSVVNAGMGGTVFQRALANTAVAMGLLNKNAVSLKGKMKNVTIQGQSFRESITAKPGEKSWLTSQVLTNTLKQFTGDLSKAQLAAMGFNAEQIKSIQATAKTAKAAATQVKTISQVFDVAKETIGSGWSSTFQAIFGNFSEAKKLFTGLSNYINKFINTNANARNRVLKDWKALGGRTDLIEGIKNLFQALLSVIKPIKDAFREIFPRQTGKQLADLTKKFRNFAASLKLSPATADGLKRTFAGLFAVLHIGVSVVGQVFKTILKLLGVVGHGSGSILNFTGSIGDFLVSLDKAITKGGLLTGFFNGLTAVLKSPLSLLSKMAHAIFGLFSGDHSGAADAFGKSLGGLGQKLGPVKKALDGLSRAWDWLKNALGKVKDAIAPWLTQIGQKLSDFGNVVSDAFKNADYDKVFAAIQTSLIGGIFLAIKKALGGGVKFDFGGGVIKNLTNVLGGLTENLKAMQKSIQATTLVLIASALAILAGAVLMMSKIDGKRLGASMSAITVGLGELFGGLAILSKFASGAGLITMPFMALSLIGLATAVTILAGAVTIFSKLSWNGIAKGLVGVGGALLAVGVGADMIGPSVILASVALIPLALGMNILAAAVAALGSLSWKELVRGLLGAAGALVAIGVGLAAVPPSALIMGPSLIALAFAMSLLGGAVHVFGQMDLKTLAKGIIGMSAALIALGIAVTAIPPTVALQAAGLALLAVGLTGIAAAVGIMGKLKIWTLIKGIAGLGAVLVTLGIGLEAMSGTLLGSAALLAAAGAFAILGPSLAFLGHLKISTILKGLLAMAAVLGVLAGVGAVAATPLALLGAALLPLAGFFIASAGAAMLLAKALVILGGAGSKGIAIMITAVTAFITVFPKMIIQFIKGLVEIVNDVAKVAPQVVDGIVKIVNSVIDVVIKSAPKLAVAIGTLVDTFLAVIVENAPKIVNAGLKLLVDFLSGIDKNIGKVVGHAASIIAKFLTTLAGHAGALVTGGVKFLVNFLSGIASKGPAVVKSAVNAVLKFIGAVGSKIPAVIAAGIKLLGSFVFGVVKNIGRLFTTGVNIMLKLISGIAGSIPKVVAKGFEVAAHFISAIARGMVHLADVGFNALIHFMNGLARSIRQNGPRLRAAGWNLADAIIDGLVQGIKDLAWRAVKAVKGFFSGLPGIAKKILGIASPSKVFAEIGMYTMAGLTRGLSTGGVESEKAMEGAANGLVRSAKNTLGNVPDLLDGIMDIDPVIKPVLDLSAVEKEATKLGDLTNVTPITAAASFDQAKAISSEKTSADTAQAAQAAQASPTFQFEQNNYSPEALSDVEIYRKTQNQLSQVKSALGLAS